MEILCWSGRVDNVPVNIIAIRFTVSTITTLQNTAKNNNALLSYHTPAGNVLVYRTNVLVPFHPFHEVTTLPDLTVTAIYLRGVVNHVIYRMNPTLSCRHKCVKNKLSSIEEVTKLGLPDYQVFRVINTKAILKSYCAFLTEQAIDNLGSHEPWCHIMWSLEHTSMKQVWSEVILFSGTNTCSSVWSTSITWRWLNVPLPTSWPLNLTLTPANDGIDIIQYDSTGW